MPGPYRVDLTRAADRDLAALSKRPPDREIMGRIAGALRDFVTDPRPSGSKKLQGREYHRIAISEYRVIYQIDDRAAVVTVVRVRHRREVYREL